MTLEESKANLPTGCDEEFGFLTELLQSKELHALVKVHNSITDKENRFIPALSNAVEVMEDVLDVLAPEASEDHPECLDLFELLQTPLLQGLLYCHDIVAQKDYVPKLPEFQPDEVPDANDVEDSIKIVQLVKSSEPLVSFAGSVILFLFKLCDRRWQSVPFSPYSRGVGIRQY